MPGSSGPASASSRRRRTSPVCSSVTGETAGLAVAAGAEVPVTDGEAAGAGAIVKERGGVGMAVRSARAAVAAAPGTSVGWGPASPVQAIGVAESARQRATRYRGGGTRQVYPRPAAARLRAREAVTCPQ